MSSAIRILMVDDHDLFREGLLALLGMRAGLQVVGQAGSSEAGFDAIAELAPDVVLLDVEMDSTPAAVRLKRMRRLSPSSKFVILTMYRDSVLRQELLESGAAAYLTKDITIEELVQVLQTVALEDPNLAHSNPGERGELLTARERQVLRLLAQGKSNRVLANELSIAEGTVKRHTSSIYSKLGVSSRIEAVNKASILGFLSAQ